MSPERARLAELARLFTRLGCTAFGGPAAHIALLHKEVVVERGWLTPTRFVDLLGVTNLIPGPNSTEMAMHVGHERAGWRGLVVAGACFIFPAVLIVVALAWLYERYGSTPAGTDLLFGITPVMVVIVVQALVKLLPTAARGALLGAVAATAMVAYLLGVNELAVLGAAALLVLVVRRGRGIGVAVVALPLGIPAGADVTDPVSLERLFLVFLKAGALLYGSGYVLLAFLQNDLVHQLHALTDQQLLDAIAVGQATPGPVFSTATFVGYSLGGLPGAAVATVGIFGPAFVLVGLVNPLVAGVRNRPSTAALLNGVNAGALGLMAGVTVDLGRATLDHWLAVPIAVAAAGLLWRTKVGSTWMIVGGAVVGVGAGAVGLV